MRNCIINLFFRYIQLYHSSVLKTELYPLPLSRQIQQTTNLSCFLFQDMLDGFKDSLREMSNLVIWENYEKYFKIPSAENFTQRAKGFINVLVICFIAYIIMSD